MLAAREEALPKDMLPEVAARLLDVLASHCSSGALPVDRPFSRYFYTLLRTLQAAVRQVCIWLACPINVVPTGSKECQWPQSLLAGLAHA